VGGDREASLTVEAKSLAPSLSFILGPTDHLRNPLETGGEIRHLIGQVDQHIVVIAGIATVAQDNRRLTLQLNGMGKEPGGRSLPELVVQLPCMVRIPAMNIDQPALFLGLVGNAPGQRLTDTVAGLVAQIEGNFSH
jgi:hypothetical protein